MPAPSFASHTDSNYADIFISDDKPQRKRCIRIAFNGAPFSCCVLNIYGYYNVTLPVCNNTLFEKRKRSICHFIPTISTLVDRHSIIRVASRKSPT